VGNADRQDKGAGRTGRGKGRIAQTPWGPVRSFWPRTASALGRTIDQLLTDVMEDIVADSGPERMRAAGGPA